ncbi:hypothetical protein KAM353_43500 [Aeromonas caviae]|nr:hypothetical protein KAM353_43500 [Aeromonas caviae]
MQQAIRMRIEADSASGKMTETVRQSVNAALTQVEKELKQTGLEQQKPATDAFNCNDPLKSCSGHNEWRSQT